MLLVVAFHAGLPLPGGFIGVDVFLVISGFVITGMLLREIERTGTIRLRHFYERRVKRLLPALAVLTTVVMALSAFFGSSFGSQQTTASTGLGATYLAANVVIYRGSIQYFSPAASTNPLLHTWTLSVEEQTYLIFPSLLLGTWLIAGLLRRRSSSLEPGTDHELRALRASRVGVAAMLLLIGAVSFFLSLQVSMHRTATPPAWAFYSSLARVWEFAVGAGLALSATWLRRLDPRVSRVLGVAGLATILVGALTLSGDVPYPGTAALLPVLGTAAVIVAGFGATSSVSRALSTRPLVRIGDVSYSWYLWHWPLIVFASVIWPAKAWVLLVVALVSLAIAAASFAGLEQPIRGNANIRGWRVVAILAVCVCVPTAAAFALFAGARSSWGNEGVRRMQDQVTARHASIAPSCDPSQTSCASGDRARAYLVGNSIAGMYTEALIGATGELDLPLTLDTHPGRFCTNLDGQGCPSMFAQVYERLLHPARGGLVVIAGTWDTGSFSGRETEQKAEVLAERLGGLISALREAGHQVLIVLPVPRFFYGSERGTFAPAPLDTQLHEPHATVWRPQDCAATTVRRDPTACGATLQERDLETSQELAFTTLRRIAQETGASTLDLRARYCREGICTTNIGDRWMFEDGIHLSVGESEALAPTFARVLRDMLEARAGMGASVSYTYLDDHTTTGVS